MTVRTSPVPLASLVATCLTLATPTMAAPQETFQGCGTVITIPECGPVFVADDGQPYFLDNYEMLGGPPREGEPVYVYGTISTTCAAQDPIWCPTTPCVTNNDITPCIPFRACGTLVQPPFCGVSLAADSGGIWLLDDIAGFQLGDRVFVDGVVVINCITLPECGGNSCVHVETISECGESYFSGCGTIVVTQFCGVSFLADDGSGMYKLATGAEENDGQHVFVEGPIVRRCRGSGICPCIENLDVVPCIPVGDLDGDGLVDGADLAMLLAAWGPCAPQTIGCIGDLDYSGGVDGADLSILLGAWTTST